MLRILLIEDNAGDAELLSEMVGTCEGKCSLETADRLAAGIKKLDEEHFDAVFLDLGLPDSQGIETLRRLQEHRGDLPVIVLTGLADGELASRAIALGAQDYLVKGGIEAEVLYRSILYSVERKRNEVAIRERKELSDALNRLDNLIHSTLDLDAVLDRAAAGAATALGVEAAVIGLLQNDRYIIKSAHNLEPSLVGRSIASREMHGIAHAARLRDVVAFNDAARDSRVNRDMVASSGIRSMMVAPFLSRGIVLGAISFYSLARPFLFRDVHLDFARKLSFSISTALENARLYEALRRSDSLARARFAQLEAVYATAPVGLCFVDPGLRYVHINERLAELNGRPPEHHLGRSIGDVLPPGMAETVIPYYRRVLETGNAVENVELTVPGPEAGGEARYWLNSYYPVREPDGRIMGVNTVVQEITARKNMEEQIRHLANHDVLTGLPNRRLFLELISLELAQARRHGSKMAVFFLDLDRFKNINDTLGHDAGDALLQQVADGLRRTVRSSDTVARIGGDEFNIIVADVVRAEDAADVARKIINYFSRSFLVAGQALHITPSIGISVFPDDSEEIESLLRFADIAMYHAKEKGRNTYQFYNPDINTRSLERIRLESMLRESLARDELVVHYQPFVDIRTNRIVCAESLVRWNHPEQGQIEPDRFIPLAEETGFITLIDEWVLRTVCSQMTRWRQKGLPFFCVTVNISARFFENAALVPTVARILRDTGMPARCLDLEITEGLAMTNVERASARLKQLAGMGIRISIDDFGTGYSSLSYLKRLPIGRLKIDRSFIKDITTDADDRTIISAVTAMAHNMKMRVIAEGVETEEQLSFLRAAGCDEIQGFLFSKPVPAREFEQVVLKAA